ncbi:MAG: tetratricopeptide repeat protein [Bacteroidales bacterium]|nr:tetratricopeptide repeat protein [Bacteroidales bacterium]
MCSDLKLILLASVFMAAACSTPGVLRKIMTGEMGVDISVPADKPLDDIGEMEMIVDTLGNELSDGPIIMNAIRDTETGEMIATDVINASAVVARFRNAAERGGYVSISFDLTVPSEMISSAWKLKLTPFMNVQEDTLTLDPLFITGEGYRKGQLRGYQRYRQFLESIITDTSDLVRIGQLEIFLERHFPDTYAMRNDTSLISDPAANNLFGVTQADALRHYTRHARVYFNERRKARKGLMYGRYVKDPIISEGIRLDTVMSSPGGDFIYRYMHTFRSRPGLKKVSVSLLGEIYEDGELLCSAPFPDDLTYYISSLSSMADSAPKYRMMVLERNVYDNTKALIDFEKGSHAIDTSLSDNASELARVVRCIGDVVSREEYVLDSLVVMASCSPEGSYAHNSRLASARSESIRDYILEYVPEEWRASMKTSHVPENWGQMKLLVANDQTLEEDSRARLLSAMDDLSRPDEVEDRLSRMPEYRYLREKIYPRLRSVSFDFHLHRSGMLKDTVHTSELDTAYMAGVEALKNLDYKKAVEMLRPYGDYNSALAFMAADYNNSALHILERLDDADARVCYLKALVLSRLGDADEALKCFEQALSYDPYLEHRANLDPEMSGLLRKRQNVNN